MKQLAPIVLFVYNRPDHTRKTLESLMANDLADESELFIYADGPKQNATESVLKKILEVRSLIKSKKWCKTVHITESENNRSLPITLVEKVTEIVNKYGRIIVLEDDLVLGKGFLKYMNDSLSLYENNKQVMHISGYMFPIQKKVPETFFLKLATCWGWATWDRAWSLYNSSPEELLKFISLSQKNEFDMGYPHYDALVNCSTGEWKSWDIRWYASVFVHNGLCLHPYKSLVRNIGFDGSGMHTGEDDMYLNQDIISYVDVRSVKLEESFRIRKFMQQFYAHSSYKVLIKQILPVFVLNGIKYIKRSCFNIIRKNKKIDWFEHNDLLGWWGKDNVWVEVSDFLKDKSGKVLDIGCGNGTLMQILLQNKNLSVYGCDISEGLIESAKKRNGVDAAHLKVCDATDLKYYNENSFDYSYSIGLVQYLKEEDVQSFVSECYRVTKKTSYHKIPVSKNNTNDGRISSWHVYLNNSIDWWMYKFKSKFHAVEVVNSDWKDDMSDGKWIICHK